MSLAAVQVFSVFGSLSFRGLSAAKRSMAGFESQGRRTAGSAAGVAGSFSRMATGIAIAGLAVGAFAIESVRSFSEFDAAMTQSMAIMGDLADRMRTDMEDAAREVARTTTFSANQAAESYFFLASAGMDAIDSIEALPVVAQFAQAGMFDMSRATDILTDAQSALGLSVDDTEQSMQNMGRVADVLVRANEIANASVEQFGQALINRAAPRMRQFNISVEEGVAVLAAFADQGIKGNRAGMMLNIMLRDLTDAAVRNEEAFNALNIDVFDPMTGNIRDLADIIEDFEQNLGGASDAQRTAAFEALQLNRQVADALAQVMGMSSEIRQYEEDLEGAGGASRRVATAQLETLRVQLQLIGSAFRDIFLVIGRELTPVLTNFITNTAGGLENLTIITEGWARLFQKHLEESMDSMHKFIAVLSFLDRHTLDLQGTLSGLADQAREFGEQQRRDRMETDALIESIREEDEQVGELIRTLELMGEVTREEIEDITELLDRDIDDPEFIKAMSAGLVGFTLEMDEIPDHLRENLDDAGDIFEDWGEDAQDILRAIAATGGVSFEALAIAISRFSETSTDELDSVMEGLEDALESLNESSDQQVDNEREKARLRVELGKWSRDQLISFLRDELEAAEEGSLEQLRLMREIQTVEEELAREREERREEQLSKIRDVTNELRNQLEHDVELGRVSQDRLRETLVGELEILNARERSVEVNERIRRTEMDIIRSIEQEMSDLSAAFDDMSQAERAAARRRIQDLEEFIQKLQEMGHEFPELVERLSELKDELSSAAEEAGEDFSNTLRDEGRRGAESLIRGFVRGIREGDSEAIKRAIDSLVTNVIVSSLTSALDISSPSQVTRDMGVNIVEGLSVGMMDAAPRLDSTVDSIANRINFGGMQAATNRMINNSAAPAIQLDIPVDRMPPARNPLESARDEEWQEFLRESQKVAKAQNFSMGDL